MEGITPDNIKISHITSSPNRSVQSSSPNTTNATPSTNDLGSTLSAHSELVDKSKASHPDIRPDHIARAQALINDPNWLDNYNLDKLANKILQEEF
jgi:hypothetical protein